MPAQAHSIGSARRSRSCWPWLASALLALFSVQVSAAEIDYRFVDLGALLGGHSHALDVNNAGQIVGVSATAVDGRDRADRATLWQGPSAESRTVVGREWSRARAINEGGQIVGTGQTSGIAHGVLWRDGLEVLVPMTYAYGINDGGSIVGEAASKATLWDWPLVTYLDPPGSPWAMANDINNSRDIVGTTIDRPSISQYATLWNGTDQINLGALTNFRYSEAFSINDAGQVVGLGNHGNGGPYYPVLWEGGASTVLGGGAYHGYANDINEAGQIVGSAWTTPGSLTPNATLWNGNAMIDLNTFAQGSGWHLVWATGINEKGWIVGSAYQAASDSYHAYVLVPIPEPGVFALLAGGGFVVMLLRRQAGRSCRLR